jgi:hypothetical protein
VLTERLIPAGYNQLGIFTARSLRSVRRHDAGRAKFLASVVDDLANVPTEVRATETLGVRAARRSTGTAGLARVPVRIGSVISDPLPSRRI